MKHKAARLFILSAAAILLTTAAAKLISAAGEARVLNATDPLLILRMRHVMIIAGVTEFALGIFLLLRRTISLQLGLIAWIASVFVLYRLGLWMKGAPRPCGCLGTVIDSLPLDPKTVEYTMQGLAAYLLVGSLSLWFVLARSNRSRAIGANCGGSAKSDVLPATD